jgi:hypothetical protein
VDALVSSEIVFAAPENQLPLLSTEELKELSERR